MRKFIIWITLVCLVFLFNFSFKYYKTYIRSIESIEEDLSIDLPDGSTLEHFYGTVGSTDNAWIAKVVIPTSSYKEVKDKIMDKDDDTIRINSFLPSRVDWRKPEKFDYHKRYSYDNGRVVVDIIFVNENINIYLYVIYITF